MNQTQDIVTNQIFNLFKTQDMTNSFRSFSVNWLGCHPKTFQNAIQKGDDVGCTAKYNLLSNLFHYVQTYPEKRHILESTMQKLFLEKTNRLEQPITFDEVF